VPPESKDDASRDRDDEPTPAEAGDFGDIEDAERVPLGRPELTEPFESPQMDDETPFDLELKDPSIPADEDTELLPDLEANRGPRTIQSTPHRKPRKRHVSSEGQAVRASHTSGLEIRWRD
jgi:hypothetical protein